MTEGVGLARVSNVPRRPSGQVVGLRQPGNRAAEGAVEGMRGFPGSSVENVRRTRPLDDTSGGGRVKDGTNGFLGLQQTMPLPDGNVTPVTR